MPWLMKAEPDSRVVKGKDVKFSVDDFEGMGTSPWDGVRSHEAKKIMKEKMKLGDKVLFYHSNCKIPGVYALAEVCKEGYPDYTAWDPSHPYFDPKTNKEEPTWYMVSVSFESRLPHPPTLALIKHLASIDKLPEEVEYIGKDGFEAVRAMQLVNRGRLSVQPVTDEAYEAVVKLGTQGGWEDLVVKPSKAKAKVATQSKAKANAEAEIGTSPVDQVKEEVFEKESKKTHKAEDKKATRAKAARPPTPTPTEGTRRSKRVKVEH